MTKNAFTNIVSEELASRIECPCWYHGTDLHFKSWQVPPPHAKNDRRIVPHSAVFFAGNKSFAQDAGNNVAVVSLRSKANILDATKNYKASEQLRKEFSKNKIASLTLNASHDYWHEGWITGAVLRMAHYNQVLEDYLNNLISIQAKRLHIPLEQASELVQYNTTRGLIELICVGSKKLGFDALYGHELDRHTKQGVATAEPWLAVFTKDAVTEPYWLYREGTP